MKSVLSLLILLLLAGCSNNAVIDQNPSKVDPVSATPTASGPQKVTIDSADGVKLVGSLYPADNPHAKPLLLLHQWQSDRHSYDDFAKRMQAKGFAVLSIDGRGFGESTKTADGKTITAGRTDADVKAMLGDVSAAFEFLCKQQNVDVSRVGIVGASYGSSLALIYAADNPKVAAVALLSPGVNYFGNMPIEPAVKKFGDRPLLMVAADDDKESADSIRKLKEGSANAKFEIQIYPNGGHGTGLFKAKVGLDELLEKFVENTLR